MRLYIDDDSIDAGLIRLLRRGAVRNLEAAGVAIADAYHELNHWQ